MNGMEMSNIGLCLIDDAWIYFCSRLNDSVAALYNLPTEEIL